MQFKKNENGALVKKGGEALTAIAEVYKVIENLRRGARAGKIEEHCLKQALFLQFP